MSQVFGLLVQARGKLYERGIFATHRLHHPVISVGNITTGGTGKTPLVMLLAERLRDEGFRPVVLSRGYGRRSSGVVIVSAGDGPLVSWDTAGDEPFLIARRTRGVAVVVGADRYNAGTVAEKERLGNLFILDDGFQHRRLFRNVDIVAIDPVEWLAGERLLPFGRWREPATALHRAHCAVVQAPGPALGELPVPSFTIETIVDGIYRRGERVIKKEFQGQSITAFAGIAKPERFFQALKDYGVECERKISFRDHHPYTPHDLATLGPGIKITTEKDALKLDGNGFGDILHVRVSARMPDLDHLVELIRGRM